MFHIFGSLSQTKTPVLQNKKKLHNQMVSLPTNHGLFNIVKKDKSKFISIVLKKSDTLFDQKCLLLLSFMHFSLNKMMINGKNNTNV